MDLVEKAKKILRQPVCDHCLGRQFGQLLSGYTNTERGRAVRIAAAMSIDRSKEEVKETGLRHDVDLSNFHDFKFRGLEAERAQKKKCEICLGFFECLDEWVAKVKKAAAGVEAKTFLVGTKLSFELIEAEEALWERAGIEHVEPIKAEINRELGKRIENALGMKFSKSPDVNFILDINGDKVSAEINPLFVYGEYQKLARGIPQTRWPSRKYKTSIEQITAKPFLALTRAGAHRFHGLGREDIDARCLGWRPFVLELLSPKRRKIDLKKIKLADKRVKVRKLRFSNIQEVRKIKESKAEKTYSVVVECEKPISRKDLEKLFALHEVRQKTPRRVLHRRADRFRNRKVKSIKFQHLGRKKFRLIARCEAGLYVKELVSGDDGRTQPSLSSILGMRCEPKALDVLGVHVK